MRNVDCEIYISQVYRFFETNPKELKTLIGNFSKEIFFDKIKEKVYKNLESGEDITLSRSQLIDIIVDISNQKQQKNPVEPGFWRTKYGDICIN